VTFPHKEKNKVVWPVASTSGGWVRQGKYIKVFVFRKGVEIVIKHKSFWKRWRSITINLAHDIELVARSPGDDPTFYQPPQLPARKAVHSFFEPQVPTPAPHWKYTLAGGRGQYLDFASQVWMHAFVSVLAFATLALASTQVTKCIYPGIPDFLPGILQTSLLAFVSFLAAYVVDDNGVSVGQAPPVCIPSDDGDDEAEIPPELRGLVEGTLWARRRADGEPAPVEPEREKGPPPPAPSIAQSANNRTSIVSAGSTAVTSPSK